MAESMVGLKRTHRCTEVTTAHIGQEVTVMGWVQKSRNKGGIIFVDLRDRSGILQIIFEENDCGAENFAKAEKLRSEFVVAVTGRVEARSGAVNTNLATGAIEIRANSMRILSESETPPFPIEENSKTKEELRLKYRFLDLRRPDIQKNLMIRSQVATLTRAFLASEGFLEIETPTLIKSTPEGARDYLVPSRVHPGSFYALPQSPQLFKQLLMCSGYDRYFQLARCYRDEDLRADRQPEFTQIDMELSFVDVDDVLDVNERLLKKLFKEICGFDVQLPIPRMTWQEAMDRFGSDKPDLRFGMELKNVSEVVKGCEFAVFKGALENGGSVRGINARGQGHMPRKKIDALVEYAKGFGARGLAYVAISEDGTVKSSLRELSSFKETEIISNKKSGQNCINCHTFNQGNPNEMVMHMRKINAGTILIQGGACQKLNTKTPHTISNFVYPDWHPSGKQIAFSTNLTQMSFYDAHPKIIEVYDTQSDIVLYDISKNEVRSEERRVGKECRL